MASSPAFGNGSRDALGSAGHAPVEHAGGDHGAVVTRRRASYIGLSLALAAAALALSALDWSTSAGLHTNAEVAATVMALVTGALALLRFYSRKSSTFLFIGTGFLGTALHDGYHALITASALAPRLPSALDSLIPWSWTASRTFLAVLLFLSWRLARRQARAGAQRLPREHHIYPFVGLLTLASFTVFALVPLPSAYFFPEISLHRPEELVSGVLFAITLVASLRKGDWKRDGFEHWLVLCLIISVFSELVFMAFSARLFDARFDMAHLLKIASYGCVFIGLLTSVHASFRQTDALVRRVAQHTAELEVANQDLELFASSVSHDLRQPLRNMDGFAKLLSQRYGDALDQRGKDYLTRIRAAAQRMARIIDGLLRLARVRQVALQRESVDLAPIAHRIARDLQGMEPERRVTFDIAAQLPAHADPGLAGNLLENLMGNAWKFTAQEPDARITVGQRPGAAGDGEVVCFVRDNGAGFDMAFAEKLFQAFQRLHGQDEFPGLGLGLATTRRIVECHGGRIWADGRPGEGATFYFTLPPERGASSPAA